MRQLQVYSYYDKVSAKFITRIQRIKIKNMRCIRNTLYAFISGCLVFHSLGNHLVMKLIIVDGAIFRHL